MDVLPFDVFRFFLEFSEDGEVTGRFALTSKAARAFVSTQQGLWALHCAQRDYFIYSPHNDATASTDSADASSWERVYRYCHASTRRALVGKCRINVTYSADDSLMASRTLSATLDGYVGVVEENIFTRSPQFDDYTRYWSYDHKSQSLAELKAAVLVPEFPESIVVGSGALAGPRAFVRHSQGFVQLDNAANKMELKPTPDFIGGQLVKNGSPRGQCRVVVKARVDGPIPSHTPVYAIDLTAQKYNLALDIPYYTSFRPVLFGSRLYVLRNDQFAVDAFRFNDSTGKFSLEDSLPTSRDPQEANFNLVAASEGLVCLSGPKRTLRVLYARGIRTGQIAMDLQLRSGSVAISCTSEAVMVLHGSALDIFLPPNRAMRYNFKFALYSLHIIDSTKFLLCGRSALMELDFGGLPSQVSGPISVVVATPYDSALPPAQSVRLAEHTIAASELWTFSQQAMGCKTGNGLVAAGTRKQWTRVPYNLNPDDRVIIIYNEDDGEGAINRLGTDLKAGGILSFRIDCEEFDPLKLQSKEPKAYRHRSGIYQLRGPVVFAKRTLNLPPHSGMGLALGWKSWSLSSLTKEELSKRIGLL